MKNTVLFIAIGICSAFTAYSESPKKPFKPNPAIEKKIAAFKFNTTVESYNDDFEGRVKVGDRKYSFKTGDVEFDDALAPSWDKNNSKRYIGFKITLIGSDDSEMKLLFAVKKTSKQGIVMADVKKGKKKLYAMMITGMVWSIESTTPVNTETQIADILTYDEYQKSSLFQNESLDKDEPLVKSKITAAVFLADTSIKSLTYNGRIKLDDFYFRSYEECKDKYWSVQIYTGGIFSDNGEALQQFYGYVLKESKVGKKVFEIVKDGKEHNVLVKMVRPDNESKNDIVLIEGVKKLSD